MVTRKVGSIRDRALVKRGFSPFASSVSADGKEFTFVYPSGARYSVPLDCIVAWFQEPHEVRETLRSPGELRILRTRRHFRGYLVRVYLSNGSVYDVKYDTVLMSCEPLYENFGGLTAESKKLTEFWWGRHGAFRVNEKGNDGGGRSSSNRKVTPPSVAGGAVQESRQISSTTNAIR